MARQLLHAQLHQCQRLRRHSSTCGRSDGGWFQRAPGPIEGRNGRLVPAEELSTQGLALVSGRELKTRRNPSPSVALAWEPNSTCHTEAATSLRNLKACRPFRNSSSTTNPKPAISAPSDAASLAVASAV